MIFLVSLIILFISYKLFGIVSGSMSIYRLNMLSYIFYWDLLISSFLGAILVAYNVDNHYSISQVVNPDMRIYAWACVGYVLIVFPFGAYLAQCLLSNKKMSIVFNQYCRKKNQSYLIDSDAYMRIVLYFCLFISTIVVVYTYSCLQNIPFLEMLRGASASDLISYRVVAARNFSGNQYVVNILGSALIPILCYTFYAYYYRTKSKRDLYLFIYSFVLSFLITTYTMAKSPFFFFLIGFLFLRVILNGSVSKKYIFIIAAISLFGLICLYFIFGVENLTGLFHYNSGIVGRIILSQISGLYDCFYIYPTFHDHLGCTTLSSYLSYLFDIECNERAARINMEVLYPEMVNLDMVGVGNTLFIGEAWANWGVLGVLLSPLYVGFLLGGFYKILLSMRKYPLLLGIYGYYCSKSSITGGINDYIYNALSVILIIILVVVFGFSYNLYLNRNENYISHS